MVHIIATGGTIAGKIKGDIYEPGKVGVSHLFEKFGIKVQNFEQFSNIGSQDMTCEIWLKLAKRVQEILDLKETSGVVVLHGTDTLEGACYFLNLTIKSQKPVVLTGSMIAGDDPKSDAWRNLIDAIELAGSKNARNLGVLSVFSGEIFSAREVQKVNANLLNAFGAPNCGKIGNMTYGGAEILLKPNKKSSLLARNLPNSLPKVGVLYANFSQNFKEFRASSYDGLVAIGFGNGNFSQNDLEILKNLSLKMPIVRASMVCSGFIGGGEIVTKFDNSSSPNQVNFINARGLNSQKAQILLTLALAKTKNIQKIDKIFQEY